jgi:hypothetical protein
MSETMSLLLATSVLALGGMGLYLFKSDDSKGTSADYNEDEIFKNENDKENDDNDLNDEEEDYEKKPRKRNGKTKRTKKSSGTKRRY